MVRVYGMSSLGPIQYADPQGNVFLGRDYTQGGNYSNGVAAEIDKEVRKIIVMKTAARSWKKTEIYWI